jgi:hypothetical protein
LLFFQAVALSILSCFRWFSFSETVKILRLFYCLRSSPIWDLFNADLDACKVGDFGLSLLGPMHLVNIAIFPFMTSVRVVGIN